MKRGRVDVGVSKEQYEASLAAGEGAALEAARGFDRAPDKVLQARKILAKAGPNGVSTRGEEARRQFAALNRSLASSLKAQWAHNKDGSWAENMREYLAYARDVEAKLGGHKGQVRVAFIQRERSDFYCRLTVLLFTTRCL